MLCIIVKCLSNPWPLDWNSLSDPRASESSYKNKNQDQGASSQDWRTQTRLSRLQLDHLHFRLKSWWHRVKNKDNVPRTAAGQCFRAKKDKKERRRKWFIADKQLNKRTKMTSSKELQLPSKDRQPESKEQVAEWQRAKKVQDGPPERCCSWRNIWEAWRPTQDNWRVDNLSILPEKNKFLPSNQSEETTRETTTSIVEWRIDLWSKQRREPYWSLQVFVWNKGQSQWITEDTSQVPNGFLLYFVYQVWVRWWQYYKY